MSFAQVHLRSAVYALATGTGSIMDRLREAEESLSTLAYFNSNEIPSRLKDAFFKLREEISDARGTPDYPEEEASLLASRIVTLYEDITGEERRGGDDPVAPGRGV